MADRAGAKSKAKAYTKSKKKGAMDGMTVKGGHKLSVKEGAPGLGSFCQQNKQLYQLSK